MSHQSRPFHIDPLAVLLILSALASVLIGYTQDVAEPERLTRVAPWWLLAALLIALLIVYREQRGGLAHFLDYVRGLGRHIGAPGSDTAAPYRSIARSIGGVWRTYTSQTILIALAAAGSIFVVLRIIEKENVGVPHYGDVFAVWVCALVALAAAAMWRARFSLRELARVYHPDFVAIIALTGVAAALRFTALGVLPAVVGGDEGLFGMSGLAVQNGQFENPFATYYGAGTLYVHVIGGLMRLFGANPTGLRMVSAIGGTLAVPAVYLLGRELAGRRAAIIAALLVAVSHYHVHFSRMVAVTYLQGTFFNTLALYLLISGLRRNSTPRMMLSGLVLGVYFMIYLDSRMMIGTLGLMLPVLALADRPLIARNLKRLMLLVIVFAIVAAPMLLWAARHPADFNARFSAAGALENDILGMRAAETGQSVVSLLARMILATFMTLVALPVMDFYFSDLAVLSVVSGFLFLFGLVYSLMYLHRTASLLLNLWLWAGIVAIAVFTFDEFAAGYHLMFVFPAAVILAGLGFGRLTTVLRLPSRAVKIVGTLVASIIVIVNAHAYYAAYLPSCRFGDDTATRLASRLGQYLGTLDPGAHAYLLSNQLFQAGSHPSLDFLSGRMAVTNVLTPLAEAPPFDLTRPTVFVAISERVPDLDTLAQIYPGGAWDAVYDCDRRVFTAYRIP
ncbi:MAG TPA: glycosyltransferase family 39 protein [Anaerolineae bacterium]